LTITNIGLIGCGEIAEFHARALRNIDNVTVSGAYDLDHRTAQSFGKKFNVPIYSQLSELLSDSSINALYVLTRHNSHAEIISKCLAAGKHVFSEKPLALDLDTAEKIRNDVHKSGKFLMVGFNHRWNPAVDWIHDYLTRTQEKILSLSLTFSTSPFLQTWAGLAEEGGGILPGLGSHALDLACHLMCESPSHLAAFTSRQRLPDPYLPDTASVMLCMSSGALVNINFQDHSAQSYSNYGTGDPSCLIRADIFTTNWTATINSSHEILLFYKNHQEKIMLINKNPLEILGIQQENDNFIRCIKTNVTPYPNVEDGIRAIQLVKLAEEASETHTIKLVAPLWVSKVSAFHPEPSESISKGGDSSNY
jgi:predicted dehydrogenase